MNKIKTKKIIILAVCFCAVAIGGFFLGQYTAVLEVKGNYYKIRESVPYYERGTVSPSSTVEPTDEGTDSGDKIIENRKYYYEK